MFLCDPLAQEYYGTTAYIGGLGIGDELIRTCDILGINRRSTDLLYGALGNIYLYSLFDVKYLLSKNSEISTYGFKYLTTVGGINIYENTLALPVAYVMDNSVHLDKILEFDDINRQRALLKSCIVEDTEKEEGWSYNYLDFEELSKYKNKKPQENELSLVRMTIPDNDTVYIFENNQYNEPVRKGVLGRNGNEVYVEYLDTVESIEVHTTYIEKELEVDNLDVSISELNPEKYYSEIKKDIKRAQNNGLVISENNGYHIKGTINTDIDGMLVTSIPYEGPWKIKIDGEDCETEKVNMYFLGTKINKGTHEVEIYYIPDNSYINVYSGIIITLLKVVCLGLILEFGNQLYRKRLKKVNVNK